MSFEGKGELIPLGGGDNIPLRRSPLTFGRRESCDVRLHFPNVSGKHCEFLFKEGFWIVFDLGSTNGIKVNDDKVIGRKIVRPGDIITIGKRRFRISYQAAASSANLEEYMAELGPTMEVPLLEKAGLTKRQVQELPLDDDVDE